MGLPDHLTCLLRNLYTGQEATVRTGHGTKDWERSSKLGKEYIRAVYHHPNYLTYIQSISCEMPGWMSHKLESRLLGEISHLRMCRWYHSNGRTWRGTKEPLDEGERGEWKRWLKIQHIKKTNIMASSPIASWQIDGEKVEAVNILFLGSKITEDGECSHEIKRSCDKPRQCIKKQRHHLANKGPHSQRYGFSSSHVQMWELDHKEGWAPKNWCCQNMVLEKTLESLLDCKEIKSVNPKGNWPWIFIGRTDAEA